MISLNWCPLKAAPVIASRSELPVPMVMLSCDVAGSRVVQLPGETFPSSMRVSACLAP